MTNFNPNLAASPVYEFPVACTKPDCTDRHDHIVTDHVVNDNPPARRNKRKLYIEKFTIRDTHIEIGKRYFIDQYKRECEEKCREGPSGGIKPFRDTAIVHYRAYPLPDVKNSIIVDREIFHAAIKVYTTRLFTILCTVLPIDPLARRIISYCSEEDAILYALNNFSHQFVLGDKQEMNEIIKRLPPPRGFDD